MNRFLTSPYVTMKFDLNYCDIKEQLSGCNRYQTYGAVGMFQVYADVAEKVTGCQWPIPATRIDLNWAIPPYEYYRGQFFSISSIGR